MYKFMNLEKAKKLAELTSIGFMVIHIFMLFMFRNNGVTPMVYLNVVSVLFYMVMLWASKREMLRFYVVAVYLEVVLHMTMAVVCTGWDSGFQITLIGINILLFYSEYLGRYLKKSYVPSFPICLVGPVAYISSYVWINNHPPKYLLPANVSFFFQIFWGIVVFAVTMPVLYIFVELSVQSEAYLEKQAGHDQLTGLPNRHYLADSLNNLSFLQDNVLLGIANMNKSEKEKEENGYWAAMLDIDDFKRINDTYGHNCGDYILKEISQILQGWRKECGALYDVGTEESVKGALGRNKMEMTIGRWGGEEFLVVGCGGNDVWEMLDNLRSKIMKYDFAYKDDENFGHRHIRVTVTIGLAKYKMGMTFREWIGTADDRLYEGKKSGKNKVVG